MFRKLLLSTATAAGLLGAAWLVLPGSASGAMAGIGQQVCSMVPDHCLRWRCSSLEDTRGTLLRHRNRIQEGTQLLEEHAAALRGRLDAVRANGALLAQREMERRRRAIPTLEFGGRVYQAADVETQARLWDREAQDFETVLASEIATRRQQFAEARERVALAYGRVETTVRMIEADLVLAPVVRELGRIRHLSAAAEEVAREARTLLDPVRSVIEMPPLPANPPASQGGAPATGFSMEDWMQRQLGVRPTG